MRRLSLHKLTPLACLLAATLLLDGCLASGGTATVTPTPGVPADFAFRFSVNWCGDLIEIDTIAGTYTAAIREGTERGQVGLTLTPAELLVFYSEIARLDPFNLPESLPLRGREWPWSEYSLYMRMDGRTKLLYWGGNIWGVTPTTTELPARRFAYAMDRLIRERPELRELRRRGIGCT